MAAARWMVTVGGESGRLRVSRKSEFHVFFRTWFQPNEGIRIVVQGVTEIVMLRRHDSTGDFYLGRGWKTHVYERLNFVQGIRLKLTWMIEEGTLHVRVYNDDDTEDEEDLEGDSEDSDSEGSESSDDGDADSGNEEGSEDGENEEGFEDFEGSEDLEGDGQDSEGSEDAD